MPRRARMASGGFAYHVLNRAVGRSTLFHSRSDYDAFLRVMIEALEQRPTRLCAFCIMPNHWHMVLWPREDGELSEFMRWLTVTHAQRLHAFRGSTGTGPIYQGRFKSFPIEQDGHFVMVCRYVERNAMRAQLAHSAEEWRWGSAWHRSETHSALRRQLSTWPVRRPSNWLELINTPIPESDLDVLRKSLTRGAPYGNESWQRTAAAALGLEQTLRRRGRPKKGDGSLFSNPAS